MTPEQIIQFQEMHSWYLERLQQQIAYPLDEASKNSLGVGTLDSNGSTAPTRTITIPAGGGTATVPTNPIGSIILSFEGERYEIPYLSTP